MTSETILAFGDYRLDIERRELRCGAKCIDLHPNAFNLLTFLAQHRDRVVTKDDLLQAVWGGRIVSESAITTRINAVRRGSTGLYSTLTRIAGSCAATRRKPSISSAQSRS